MSTTTISRLLVLLPAVVLASACGGGNPVVSPAPASPSASLVPTSSDQTQVAALVSAVFIAALQQSVPAVVPSAQTSNSDLSGSGALLAEPLATPQSAETGNVAITYGLASLPATPLTETIPLEGTGVVFGTPYACDFKVTGNVMISWTPGVGGTATATENLDTTILACGDGATYGSPPPVYPVTFFQSWGIPISGLQMTCRLAIAADGSIQPAEVCTLSGSITFYDPNPCDSLPQNQDTPACNDTLTLPVNLTYTFADFPSQPAVVTGSMGTPVTATLPSVPAPSASLTSPPPLLTVSLSPPMDVQACVPGSAVGESVNLQNVQVGSSGDINSTWYVQNGAMTSFMQVTGSLTATSFSATLTCTNGGGTGSLTATGTNYNYNGTYTLNTQ